MKIRSWLACASILVLTNALAQGQTSVQGGASASAQGTATTDRPGANAASSAAGSGSASARAAGKEASAALAGGSELNATLTKPLDAKKNKPGDEVVATVTQDVKSNGQIVIPRGAKLIGHVTQTKAHGTGKASASASRATDGAASATGSTSGAASTAASTANAATKLTGTAAAAADSSSRLGVVFDRAVLKNGSEVPLQATIQALAAAKVSEFVPSIEPRRPNGESVLGGVSNTASGTLGGASSIGGAATGTVGSTVQSGTHASAGALGGLNAAGNLSSGSRGVFDMKGLSIQSATTGSAQGSVITSPTRNVHLDAGTQMLLTINAL